MKITDILEGKRVLIWGYGREGKSTERFIRDFCHVQALSVYEGKKDGIREDDWDCIIKSPGIKAEGLSEKYTSQTQLFLEEFRDRTVGVTGTKGKSTTSSLLYTVLAACSGRKTFLVGNIGYPCLDYYGEIDDNSLIVFEMSCHQLSTVTLSPHTAVFLNLYEEHLDYYGTFDRYFAAKKNITLFQTEEDYFSEDEFLTWKRVSTIEQARKNGEKTGIIGPVGGAASASVAAGEPENSNRQQTAGDSVLPEEARLAVELVHEIHNLELTDYTPWMAMEYLVKIKKRIAQWKTRTRK